MRSSDPSMINCYQDLNTEMSILDAIKSTTSEIDSLVNDEDFDEITLGYLEECLNNLIYKMGAVMIVDSLYSYAERREKIISFYSDYDEFKYRIIALGTIVETRNYDRARSFLNTIETINEEQENFLYSQNIFIDYLTNSTEFELSNEIKQQLEAIAVKDYPLSIYTENILYYIEEFN